LGPRFVVLGLDDHAPRPVPAAGGVGERAEETLGLTGAIELPLGPIGPVGGGPLQRRVAGQAQDVADAVRVAPAHQSPATEAAVGPDGDPHPRPGRPQAVDEQFEHGPGVPGGVDVRRPQVGRQQLIAAEDIERQEAMMIIVPVEEAALLVAVDRVVGGAEVEHQVLGRLGMGGEELIDEHGGDADQRRAVDAVLQAGEGRRAG
jgi:hypothetical protein